MRIVANLPISSLITLQSIYSLKTRVVGVVSVLTAYEDLNRPSPHYNIIL